MANTNINRRLSLALHLSCLGAWGIKTFRNSSLFGSRIRKDIGKVDIQNAYSQEGETQGDSQDTYKHQEQTNHGRQHGTHTDTHPDFCGRFPIYLIPKRRSFSTLVKGPEQHKMILQCFSLVLLMQMKPKFKISCFWQKFAFTCFWRDQILSSLHSLLSFKQKIPAQGAAGGTSGSQSVACYPCSVGSSVANNPMLTW